MPFKGCWQVRYNVIHYDVVLDPDLWPLQAPPLKKLAESIKALQPSGRIELPFDIWPETSSIVKITASYEVEKVSDDYGSGYEKLDMWRGKIDAKPITIKIKQ